MRCYRDITGIFLVCLLSAGVAVGYQQEEPTVLDRLLNMPFESISYGNPLELESTAVMPKLERGGLVSFYRGCKGAVKYLPSTQASKPLSQPWAAIAFRSYSANGALSTRVNAAGIAVFSLAGGVEMKEDAVKIATVISRHSVNLETAEKAMATDTVSSAIDMVSSAAKVAAATQLTDVTQEVASRDAQVLTVQADSNTETGDKDVARHQDSGEQKTFTSSTDISGTKSVEGKEKSVEKKVFVSMHMKRQGEGFGALDEPENLEGNYESDSLDKATDNDSFDNDTSMEKVSLDEINDFANEVLCGDQVALDTALSNAVNLEAACVEPSVTMANDINPAQIFHGHQAELKITLVNNGDAPVSDLVVVGKLPEHTTFSEFKGSSKKSYRSYFESYSKRCNSYGAKLKRQLKPGERFVLSVVVNIDPWQLPQWNTD